MDLLKEILLFLGLTSTVVRQKRVFFNVICYSGSYGNTDTIGGPPLTCCQQCVGASAESSTELNKNKGREQPVIAWNNLPQEKNCMIEPEIERVVMLSLCQAAGYLRKLATLSYAKQQSVA